MREPFRPPKTCGGMGGRGDGLGPSGTCPPHGASLLEALVGDSSAALPGSDVARDRCTPSELRSLEVPVSPSENDRQDIKIDKS